MNSERYTVLTDRPGVLAMGDASSAVRDSDAFDVVVLCAQEFQPGQQISLSASRQIRPRILRAPFDDADLSPQEARIAEDAAEKVAHAVARGGRVLVTCMAGRNRSGLVSALALRRLYGGSAGDAIRHIRERRQGALSNPSFVRFVQDRQRTYDQIGVLPLIALAGAVALLAPVIEEGVKGLAKELKVRPEDLPDYKELGPPPPAEFGELFQADYIRYVNSLRRTLNKQRVENDIIIPQTVDEFDIPFQRLVHDPNFRQTINKEIVEQKRAAGRTIIQALQDLNLSPTAISSRFGVRNDVAALATNALLGERAYVVDEKTFDPRTGIERKPRPSVEIQPLLQIARRELARLERQAAGGDRIILASVKRSRAKVNRLQREYDDARALEGFVEPVQEPKDGEAAKRLSEQRLEFQKLKEIQEFQKLKEIQEARERAQRGAVRYASVALPGTRFGGADMPGRISGFPKPDGIGQRSLESASKAAQTVTGIVVTGLFFFGMYTIGRTLSKDRRRGAVR